MRADVSIYVHIKTYVQLCKYIYIHTYMRLYAQVHKYKYRYVWLHIYIYTHAHAFIQLVHTGHVLLSTPTPVTKALEPMRTPCMKVQRARSCCTASRLADATAW